MLVRGSVRVLRLKSQRSVQKVCELAASISLLPTPDFKEGSIARSCKVQYGNLKPELYIVRSGSSFLYLGMVSLLQVPLSFATKYAGVSSAILWKRIYCWRVMTHEYKRMWLDGREMKNSDDSCIHLLLQQICIKCLLVLCRHVAGGGGGIPEQNRGSALWDLRSIKRRQEIHKGDRL